MIRYLASRTADELWLSAAEWFASDGLFHLQEGRTGNTTEVLHAAFALSEPRQRWIGSRVPPINPCFAIAEVIWIMQGRRDAQFLNYFNSKLPDFAGRTENYHGAYGYRLRKQFGFDQLARAYDVLSKNPTSRQVVLQIWDPRSDFPLADGKPTSEDTPCNVSALLKLRHGKLEWLQVMRSNDIFLGLPYNLIQFTTLHEILAGWLEVELGDYNHISDSLHLYERDRQKVPFLKPQPLPPNTDSLSLPRDESVKVWNSVSQLTEEIVSSSTKLSRLVELREETCLPQGYANMFYLLLADVMRRRGLLADADDTLSRCTNNCLSVACKRWWERKR